MSEIEFLNIDLDIESKEDISPIVEEWEGKITVFRNDKAEEGYFASFETQCSGVEEIINEYVRLVNSLSEKSREIWDRAEKRTFDFGFESGTEPNNFNVKMDQLLIQKLADIGGGITITIYPIRPDVKVL